MKDGLHPEYFNSRVICVCGNTFEIGSTKKENRVDVCSSCHPFFTGRHKLVDTEGRIERFRKKYANVGTQAKK